MGPTLLEAAMVDTGPMARGPRRPWSGQGCPRKGRGRRRRALSGHPYPGVRAGPGLTSPLSFGTREGRHPAQRIGKQRWLRASHPSQALPGPDSASLSWGPSQGLRASRGCADRKLQVPWRADSYPNPKLARAPPSCARAARLSGHEWAEKFPCP